MQDNLHPSRCPGAQALAVADRRSTATGAHARGAAMMEFVLTLPLILLILMLVFFFGRGMTRVQNAINMTHHELWRQSSPARHVDGSASWSVSPAADDEANRALNQTFFRSRADSIEIDRSRSFPYDAGRELVYAAAGRHNRVGDLANDVHFNRSSPGRAVTTRTVYQETVRVWQQFDPRIGQTQIGFGYPWSYVYGFRVTNEPEGEVWHYDPSRRSDPRVRDAIRLMYLADFDQRLASVPAIDADRNPLASRLRSTYAHRPGYSGPEVRP